MEQFACRKVKKLVRNCAAQSVEEHETCDRSQGLRFSCEDCDRTSLSGSIASTSWYTTKTDPGQWSVTNKERSIIYLLSLLIALIIVS